MFIPYPVFLVVPESSHYGKLCLFQVLGLQIRETVLDFYVFNEIQNFPRQVFRKPHGLFINFFSDNHGIYPLLSLTLF